MIKLRISSSGLVLSNKASRHQEQDEVHQHQSCPGQIDGPWEGLEGVVVDLSQEGRGGQRNGGLQAAQQGVDLPQLSLSHSFGQLRPDDCGDLRPQQTNTAG